MKMCNEFGREDAMTRYKNYRSKSITSEEDDNRSTTSTTDSISTYTSNNSFAVAATIPTTITSVPDTASPKHRAMPWQRKPQQEQQTNSPTRRFCRRMSMETSSNRRQIKAGEQLLEDMRGLLEALKNRLKQQSQRQLLKESEQQQIMTAIDYLQTLRIELQIQLDEAHEQQHSALRISLPSPQSIRETVENILTSKDDDDDDAASTGDIVDNRGKQREENNNNLSKSAHHDRKKQQREERRRRRRRRHSLSA